MSNDAAGGRDREVGTKPLSPYFKALARAPRVCPQCLKHRLRFVSLELTRDGAVWKCDGCGWFRLELAPENAKLGVRSADVGSSDNRRFHMIKP